MSKKKRKGLKQNKAQILTKGKTNEGRDSEIKDRLDFGGMEAQAVYGDKE